MSTRRVLRAIALWPPIARPGYWFATLCAFLWGCLLLGHFQRRVLPDGRKIHYFTGLPRWAFGRGGTTVGAIFLTQIRRPGDAVLGHEAVHKEQWRRYGLAMIPLYIAAGRDPLRNRFEVEAGLEAGGYVRAPHGARPAPPSRPTPPARPVPPSRPVPPARPAHRRDEPSGCHPPSAEPPATDPVQADAPRPTTPPP